jgi:hypothetical protein
MNITEFLARAAQGNNAAMDALISKVYPSLRQLANR